METSTAQKHDKGEIAKVILSSLLLAGAFVMILAMPNLAQLLKYVDIEDGKIKLKINRSASNLKRRGLIKMERRGGEVFVALTDKGRKEALLNNLEFGKFDKHKKWDGKWRIVLFDIPENKRTARKALNKLLRNAGCFHYQKSVFITPFECKKEVDFLGDYFDIRKHIFLITANEIENESRIRKHFNL
ncbi:MAG: CRISPR-associated endonuclease Cas2 [Patescibacteria group bacterium]